MHAVQFLDLDLDRSIQLIDVRAPIEFAQGHIPGAVNIPLFADKEREEIGTVYKQVGRETALQLGEKIARPKVDAILQEIQSYLPAELVLYCWRGGKRSGAVCDLVNDLGIPAKRIEGGYKAYRRAIRKSLEMERKLLIVGGKTGSGKTALLQELKKKGLQVIDLEGLAHHKGSVFGHINEKRQPTTEQFENNFFEELRKMDPKKMLLLENESYVIGSVHLPPPLLLQMRAAPLLIVEVPVKARIDRLVKEYATTEHQILVDACMRIKKKLTKAKFDEVVAYIIDNDFENACTILLGYYDHYYNRGLNNRNSQEIYTISLDGVDCFRDAERVAGMLQKHFS